MAKDEQASKDCLTPNLTFTTEHLRVKTEITPEGGDLFGFYPVSGMS